MSTALWIAATCLGFLLLVYLFQHRLLYFPQRVTVEALVSAELRAWPTAAEFRGLLAEPKGAVRGTVVVFHGNAGHVGHRAFYAQALVPLGFRVILAEYPGYGPRPGDPGEANFIRDAAEIVALAHDQFGAPLLLLGESLGAAVAAGAGAVQGQRVAGLVLITPWDRLAHVASHHYPWLPVKWLLRDAYDTAARLAHFDQPVHTVVAERDHIVPARFGVALHAGLMGPKRLLSIEGAGHNDWPGHVDAAWWHRAMGHKAMGLGP